MQTISQFLDSKILEKKQLLEKLTSAILPLLPEASHSHILVANYDNQILTLIADSPVWAARLRTQRKAILNSLENELHLSVRSFSIKLHQPTQVKPAQLERRILSGESATIIRQTANSISDEALKESLLRLSRNAD